MDINELESFKLSDAVKFHKELNPKLWEDHKLDPEVRDQLLLIAEDFVEYLGISNLKVKDVTISGSNAAYSYTPHSDLDLHVLVDFNELPNDEVYQELFTAKKTLYNDAHDITVRDVPVELYVQDINQPVQSLGEYSILHDKWIRIPKKRRANFDQVATKAKYEKLGDLIELALKTKDSKRVADTIALVKRYRKSGLEKTGEFGPENLAYKAVRKQGLVQALYDLKSQLHAEKLSIEEESLSEKINTDILNKDFDVKKKIDLPKVGPLILHAHYLTDQIAPQFKVNVITPDGKKVGYFRFVVRDYEPDKKLFGFKVKSKLDPYILGGNVSVSDDYQKKGIATAVYDFVKELGNDIKPSSVQTDAGKAMWKSFDRKTDEDYDPNGPPPGPEFKPTMPAGTVKVDVSDVYDWYKLGQHISNMKGLGKHDFGKGPPSTIMAFGSEPEEHKYIKDLEKTGLTTTDIDPVDKNQPKGMKPQKTDPTYNVNETDDRTAAVLKIQKHLNKKYGANLDLDGKLGPLTLKSINKFMPRASKGLADEPNKTTAVQGKKLKESSSAKIDAHRVGDTIWINYFEVPVKGKGLGRAEYEKFEKSLPKDIKKIRLVASDAGYGPTHDFWDRMGFDYAYPDDDNEMVKLLEAPRTFQSQVTPLEKLIQDYGYFTSFGTVHLDKQATTPDGQQQLLSLVQRLQKDSKSFNGLDKQKIETNRDTILNHIYQMMQYAIPILKKHLPADAWEAKRGQINSVLTAYNNARQINEASGYIPSEKEKNDPRFKTALTVDVRPDANKKNAKAFGWKVSRAGIPPQARPDGKIK